MVFISRLKLRNFKSFKAADIQLPETFTCFAGPNGSGKSNVCDAIRFAMGESSLKSLRAKKVKDLIHTGSKTAEVSLVFENPASADSSYEIKRAIREDGKIRYRLNGKKTTRSAILDALKKHNLDDSGRNIIAQGEVQRIIDMNGKERRGIIDSVAGIADFEDKKKEAMGELNLVKDRIKEAQLVMGERKAFLDELGREKETALKFLESRKTLTNAKGTLLKKELDKLDRDHSEAISAEARLSAAKAALDEEAGKIEAQISEVDGKRVAVNDEIQSKQKTGPMIRKLEELKASCASKGQIIEDKEKALQKARDRMKEISDEIAKEKEELDSFSKQVNDLKASLKEAEGNLALHGGASEDGKTSGIRIKLESIEKEISSMRERLAGLSSEAIAKRETVEAKKAELERLAPKGGKEDEIQVVGGESEEHLRKQAGVISHELEESFARVKEINSRMAALDKEMLELREKAAIYRVSSSPQMANPALRFISEMAKSKGSGIYGTVADLISFEPKYAQAVEAAGGARLMYVVVDSMDTAAQVIDKLKKAREGRATFIPLDTIRPPQSAKASGKTSIIDVIESKDQVGRAIEYVFAETLLVDSVADARKTGIGTNRMVTLEGEIFERSGVVSGGRTQSSLLAGNQARKIESDLADAKAAREAMISELGSIREEESRIRAEKSQIEIKLKTMEMRREMEKDKDAERESLNKRKEQLKADITLMEENLEARSAEREKIARQIAEKSKALDAIREDLRSSEDESRRQLDEASRKRSELTSAVSSLKATIEGKKNELELRKSSLKAKEDQLAKLGRDEKEIIEKMGQVRKQIETESQELVKAEEGLRHTSKEVEKLFDRMKEFEGMFQKLGGDRGKLRIEIDKIAKDMNQVEVKKATATTRLSDLKAEFESYREFQAVEASKEELNRIIKEAEAAMNDIGNVNMTSIEMYDKKKAEIEGVQGKIEQLDREREAIMAMIDEIEIHKKEAFFEAFNSVSENFTKLFTYINIGQGHLYLNDPANPFESGMFIKLRRNNQEHSLDALSGGEKTFVALMFAFALQLFKPAPFYILDEVDSALDKPNSKNLAELVTKLGGGSQFILVTHNDIVMSNSDTVIGVARADGVSRLVGIKLKQVAST
jgi:chromosome segregation protein